MITIYNSNKLEILKNNIVDIIQRNPLNNIFEKEIIIIPNKGITQWLQIELTYSIGIVANIDFQLPKNFIWNICNLLLFNSPKSNFFIKKKIFWKIMKIIPMLLNQSEFIKIKKYLDNDINQIKLYQLSCKIANLFEQYLIYRPQWLEFWNNKHLIDELSHHQLWQQKLWLKLIDYNKTHNQSKWYISNIIQQVIKNHHLNILKKTKIPKRIFIYGINSLPSVYFQILQILGKYMDIYIMFFNPYRYYLINMDNYILNKITNDNIKNNKNIIYHMNNKQLMKNSLFFLWGKTGKTFLHFILNFKKINIIDNFIDYHADSLLHKLQQNILNFKYYNKCKLIKKTINNLSFLTKIHPKDKSITFHSCHTIHREIEILYDYLLDLFEQEPSLIPKDIIIMVPNIDNYIPHIKSVFNNTSTEYYLPFSIIDQKKTSINPILEAFVLLLDLPNIKCTNKQILNLLEVPALANKFSIYNNEVSILYKWIHESGICWGLNNKDIETWGLPITEQNTWTFGLNRMLLGYMMDSNLGIWNKISPYNECIGLSAKLIGQLAIFIDLLTTWKIILKKKRTLSQWLSLCKCLLDVFFENTKENESILIYIYQKWKQIIETGIMEKYKKKISINIIKEQLIVDFYNQEINQSFITGTIQFCNLVPMRVIPCKIICLLGMNDLIYPHSIQSSIFNLILEQPELNDKNNYNEDCYLFLEILNSVKNILYISYIEFDTHNNQRYNRSLLVNQLIEYISNNFYLIGNEHLNIHENAIQTKKHLIIQHTHIPIITYFTKKHHQSYADKIISNYININNNNNIQLPCLSSLSCKKEYNEISLEQLLLFYRHPIRTFFQKKLKVNFINDTICLSEEEPFYLNYLERYKLNQYLLTIILHKKPLDTVIANLQAIGKFPVKYFGKIFLEQQIKEMQLLTNKIKQHDLKLFDKSLMEIFDNNTYLIGKICNINNHGVIRYRPASLTINDGLSLWIEHLIYCLIINPATSYYFGKNNNKWCFEPIEKNQAKFYLQQLINGYKRGINSPLLLFTQSGWKWLIACYDKKINQFNFQSENILYNAHQILIHSLNGSPYISGEFNDIYIKCLLNKIDNNFLDNIKKNAYFYLSPIFFFKKHNF